MLVKVVARGGVEPPTFRFSVGRSYQLSYLAGRANTARCKAEATQTGLEPATFAVTGRRANQLRHWALLLFRAPNGIRTRAAALKGRSPRPLDDGDLVVQTCPRRWPAVSTTSIGHRRDRMHNGCAGRFLDEVTAPARVIGALVECRPRHR
jgi:hypothetical protein